MTATLIKGHHSPASSLSSSISIISSSHSLSDDDSEELIVWSGSNSLSLLSQGTGRTHVSGDDDFVLLSPLASNDISTLRSINDTANDHRHHRVPSSISSLDSLISEVKALKIEAGAEAGSRSSTPATATGSPRKSRRKRRSANNVNHDKVAASPQSPTKSSISASESTKGSKAKARVAKNVSRKSNKPIIDLQQSIGLGERPIVDDVSEYSVSVVEPSFYENAVQFMGSVLSSPSTLTSTSRLPLLQALIIELGLIDSETSLPQTVTSARALLRSNVFVNIIDYLDAREKGQEAIREIMHKSRGALVKDLRKKRTQRAKLGWVKESGLSVLLVSCY